MIKSMAALLLTTAFTTSAFAGPISKPGDSIEVETYRCTVTSERSIECVNIGRVCEAARAKEKKQRDYYLGCALTLWKAKHPGEECLEHPYYAGHECIPLLLGGF